MTDTDMEDLNNMLADLRTWKTERKAAIKEIEALEDTLEGLNDDIDSTTTLIKSWIVEMSEPTTDE